jgi:hypothetical protein
MYCRRSERQARTTGIQAYLATLELNKVLDPIDDGECAVGVPLTNVASAEPTVLGEYTLILIQVGALVIALDNRRTADTDFTLRWFACREVPGIWNIKEFDFHGRNRETSDAILHQLRWKDTAHATSLGQAVAYENVVSMWDHKRCDDDDVPWSIVTSARFKNS